MAFDVGAVVARLELDTRAAEEQGRRYVSFVQTQMSGAMRQAGASASEAAKLWVPVTARQREVATAAAQTSTALQGVGSTAQQSATAVVQAEQQKAAAVRKTAAELQRQQMVVQENAIRWTRANMTLAQGTAEAAATQTQHANALKYFVAQNAAGSLVQREAAARASVELSNLGKAAQGTGTAAQSMFARFSAGDAVLAASTGNVRWLATSLTGLGISISVVIGALLAAGAAAKGFRELLDKGVGAIDSFKTRVGQMSAQIQNAYPAAPFEQAYAAAERLIPLIERMDVLYSGSGAELTQMAKAMTTFGGSAAVMKLLTDDTGKAKAGFIALAETIKQQTSGIGGFDVQLMQEIRNLMTDQIERGGALVRYFKSMGADLGKVKEALQAGDWEYLLQFMGGAQKAAEKFSETLTAQRESFKTIVDRFLRTAFPEAYQALVGLQKRINSLLFDQSGELTKAGDILRTALKGGWESVRMAAEGTWYAIRSMFGEMGKSESVMRSLVTNALTLQLAFSLIVDTVRSMAVMMGTLLAAQVTGIHAVFLALTGNFQKAVGMIQEARRQIAAAWRDMTTMPQWAIDAGMRIEGLRRRGLGAATPATGASDLGKARAYADDDEKRGKKRAQTIVEIARAKAEELRLNIELARTDEQRAAAEKVYEAWRLGAIAKYRNLASKDRAEGRGFAAQLLREMKQEYDQKYQLEQDWLRQRVEAGEISRDIYIQNLWKEVEAARAAHGVTSREALEATRKLSEERKRLTEDEDKRREELMKRDEERAQKAVEAQLESERKAAEEEKKLDADWLQWRVEVGEISLQERLTQLQRETAAAERGSAAELAGLRAIREIREQLHSQALGQIDEEIAQTGEGYEKKLGLLNDFLAAEKNVSTILDLQREKRATIDAWLSSEFDHLEQQHYSLREQQAALSDLYSTWSLIDARVLPAIRERLRGINEALIEQALTFRNFLLGAADSVEGAFDNFFEGVMNRTKGLGDLWNDIVASIERQLASVLTKLLISPFFERLEAARRKQAEAPALAASSAAATAQTTGLTNALGQWATAASALPGVFGNWIGTAVQLVGGFLAEQQAAAARGIAAVSDKLSADKMLSAAWGMAGAAKLMNEAADKMAAAGIKGGGGSSIVGLVGGLLGLQAGGIVTRPTLAVVGEAGPEAVIPLRGMGQSGAAQIGAGQTFAEGAIQVTINLDPASMDALSVDRMSDRVMESIGRKMSRLRPAWGSA